MTIRPVPPKGWDPSYDQDYYGKPVRSLLQALSKKDFQCRLHGLPQRQNIWKCFPVIPSPWLFNSWLSQPRSNEGCSGRKGKKKKGYLWDHSAATWCESSFVPRGGKKDFSLSVELVQWVDVYPQTLRNPVSQDFTHSGVLYTGTLIDS